jgi:hypothetical protein
MSPVRPTRPASPRGGDRDAALETDLERERTARRARREAAGPGPAQVERLELGRALEIVDEPWLAAPRIAVRRPDDLLVGDLSWRNLRLVRGLPPRLVRDDASAPSFLRVELPPQAFGERAFLAPSFTSDGEPSPALGTLRLRMAGRSRLVVRMPRELGELPYALGAVLRALREWPMALVPAARPDRYELPPPGQPLPPPNDGVHALLGGDDFRELRADLVAGVARLGDAALARDVHAAGLRIADATASALAATDARVGAAAVQGAMRRELERLAQLHASMRDAGVRDRVAAAVGATALDATLARPDLARAHGWVVERVPPYAALLAPRRPRAFETALEVPYRIVVSPIGRVRWRHRSEPGTLRTRTELWHTRVVDPVDPPGRETGTRFRAVWSDDLATTDAERATLVARSDASLPFRMSLDPLDRCMLVELMAGWTLRRESEPPATVGDAYVPTGAAARLFGLSALGAMLDATGAWPVRPRMVDLEAWRHILGLGRDQYVRVVYAGHLLPFGHAASLVKVTERTFEGERDARRAVLRQRFFVVVRQRRVTIDATRAATGGRDLPFTAVECLTTVSPPLLNPTDDACLPVKPSVMAGPFAAAGVARRMCFWPILGTDAGGGAQPMRFELVGIDHDGRRATFTMPLVFVSEVANVATLPDGVPLMRVVQAAYTQSPATPPGPTAVTNPAIPDDWRAARFGGQHVAFAPDAADVPCPPRLPTQRMRFRLDDVRTRSTTAINAHPGLAHTDVELPPVRRLIGRAAESVSVVYDRRYVAGGFGAGNPAELFLALRTPIALVFGGGDAVRSDALGAIASPAMTIAGLSRRVGAAADLDALSGEVAGKAAAIHPATYFGDARILGGLRLRDLIDPIPATAPGAPRWTTRELGDRVEARFDWDTVIATSRDARFIAGAGGATRFRMSGVVTVPAGGGAPQRSAEATLSNFRIDIFGQLRLRFDTLDFRARPGRQPDVAIALHPTQGVEFGGALEFMDQLRRLIPSTGFGDGATLEVTPAGIAAAYTVALPAIQVGVFALSNVQLSAGFALPFDSRPATVQFSFATRERPFSLSVSLLGGGGFVALALASDGIREVEAAIEFGAEVAVDLGVASGKVEIKAGVYFSWLVEGEQGSVTLAGYVRVHGEVDVMGLISASITLTLQLGFTKGNGRALVFGEASLIIEIEVLVFSGEVEIRVRREFANPDADPTVRDLLPSAEPWAEYCAAFAPE